MAEKQNSPFPAELSPLRYFNQYPYASLESIRKTKKYPEFRAPIENFDDIPFEKDGKMAERLQIKHHIWKTGSVTNASVDLWKTLRIWRRAQKGKING